MRLGQVHLGWVSLKTRCHDRNTKIAVHFLSLFFVYLI